MAAQAYVDVPDELPVEWLRLRGHLPDAVLYAPFTCGDTQSAHRWPAVHDRVVRYLERHVIRQHWGASLALGAAIVTARRRDVRTVREQLARLHRGFSLLFGAAGVQRLAPGDINALLPTYLNLNGVPFPGMSGHTRVTFLSTYHTWAGMLTGWHTGLPHEQQVVYEPYLLPEIHPLYVPAIRRQQREVLRQQRVHRKEETGAILPHLAAIRATAHQRYQQLVRLEVACAQAIADAATAAALPFEFSYEDDVRSPLDEEPHVQRLYFRLWDRRSFALQHADRYSAATRSNARRGLQAFASERDEPFIEFVRAESAGGEGGVRGVGQEQEQDGRTEEEEGPAPGPWFLDLLRHRVVGWADRCSEDRLRYLQGWGYGVRDSEGRTARYCSPFASKVSGLLTWPSTRGTSEFMHAAQKRAEGLLIPVTPLRIAAAFGLLAAELFTTTGMRINELLQIRLEPQHLVRLVMPAPPGASTAAPRIRYALRLIPKGEREDVPQHYYLGRQALQVMYGVVQLLLDYYQRCDTPHVAHRSSGTARQMGLLPLVTFDPGNGRAHRFTAGRYLFQYAHRHLDDETITACMRFLLHGLAFRTTGTGQPIVLKSHLLRHTFATYAAQVEGVPLEIVGALLKQRNLDVTAYYSSPTEGMIADAADDLLARLATHLDGSEGAAQPSADRQRSFRRTGSRSRRLSADRRLWRRWQ